MTLASGRTLQEIKKIRGLETEQAIKLLVDKEHFQAQKKHDMHLKIKIFFGMAMLSTVLLLCSTMLRVLILEDSYNREQRLIHDYEVSEGKQAKLVY